MEVIVMSKWIPVLNNNFPEDNIVVQITYESCNNAGEFRCDGFAYRKDDAWYWNEEAASVKVEVKAWRFQDPYDPYEENDEDVDTKTKEKINIVTVRWFDSYMEEFRATEVRTGAYYLWMRLENGTNRQIPTTQLRWFGTSIESHQRID